jgi:hypothetical protein
MKNQNEGEISAPSPIMTTLAAGGGCGGRSAPVVPARGAGGVGRLVRAGGGAPKPSVNNLRAEELRA